MTEQNKLARETIADVYAQECLGSGEDWPGEAAKAQDFADAVLQALADCGYVIVDNELLQDVVEISERF